jgi:hypothetical protein
MPSICRPVATVRRRSCKRQSDTPLTRSKCVFALPNPLKEPRRPGKTRPLFLSDPASDRSTRARAYHAALQDLAPDFRLPDANAEAQDPDAADGIYRAVNRRLIDLRRGPKHPLIHNDNIAYGFWRNLLGMRGAALVLAVCASAAIVVTRTTQMTTGNMPLWAIARDAPATQVAAVVLLFLWIAFLLIIVRPPRVWDAGVAYAERLLASLPPPSVPKPKGRAPKGENQGAP